VFDIGGGRRSVEGGGSVERGRRKWRDFGRGGSAGSGVKFGVASGEISPLGGISINIRCPVRHITYIQ